MFIISRKVLVSLRVLYYMPDHRSIIQEFIWQTEDVKPKYPRVNKYLNFCSVHIDAVIADIEMAESEQSQPKIKSVVDIFKY